MATPGHLVFGALLLARTVAAEEWRHELSKGGVEVSSRAVEGSKVRELRAVTTIAAPVARIAAVLDDVGSYPGRVPPTVEARIIGPDRWYMVIDPGFIAKRDYCVEVARETLPGGGRLNRWWSIDCPLGKLVRIVHNRGSWVLTPAANGTTHVVYHSHTDPGGAVPVWLMNLAAPGKLPEIMSALRKAVMELL